MGNSRSKGYSDLSKEKDASKPLNVIILGRHKVGKSTVGNAILGRRVFTFWSFFHKGCVEKQGNVNGRFIKVVHAPGWTGFNHTTSKYNKGEIKYSNIHKGLVACVLVISIDSEFTEKDVKAAEQHMELIGGSVWKHTVLVFIRHKPDESNQKETDIMNKHKWFTDKCGKSWHTHSKDNVNDLIEKLVGAATLYNGNGSCFKANNSALSQESQMDSQCPEETTETENGRLQKENIELQQQATTSIRSGTTPESHPELSSASENTSGELREVFKIHVPPGPDSQQGQSDVNGNMATLEKVYNKSMATVTSQKKDLAQFCSFLTSDEPGSTFVQELKQEDHKLYQRLGQSDVNGNMATLKKVYNKSMATVTSQKKVLAQFCRYLTSDEPGSTFVQELKQEDHELYQRLAVTFANEHDELVQKVTTVRSIADALYSKKMVDNELNSRIQAEKTSQEKMRLLYEALDSAEAVKAAFFELLAQKQFSLVQDLAKKKLQELEASNTAAD